MQFMKAGIHPNYQTAKISCACGANYEIGSSKEAIEIELCSACHPFYTGKQKVVDTARRVEKFQARAVKAEDDSATGHAAKLEKKAKRAKARQEKREAQEKAEA